MPRCEIRIAGSGGQGVLKAGALLSKALFTHYNENVTERSFHVTETESYGPASRGCPSRSDIVIHDDPNEYLSVEKADFMILMSQNAYDTYIEDVKEGGVAIINSTLVKPKATINNVKIYNLPATEMAKRRGMEILANIILLGAFIAVTKFIDIENMKRVISEEFPVDKKQPLLEALMEGYNYITNNGKNKTQTKANINT